jgi:hypothetical protein
MVIKQKKMLKIGTTLYISHFLLPDELASFKGTSSCENFLKERFSNLWVNVSYIPAFAHKQKRKCIKYTKKMKVLKKACLPTWECIAHVM